MRSRTSPSSRSRRRRYLAWRVVLAAGWAAGLCLLAVPVLYVLYRGNLLLDWWTVLGGDPNVPVELRQVFMRGGGELAPRFDALAALRALPLALLGPALTLLFYMALFIVPMIGLFWWLSRGRTYVIYPGEYDVSFDDVRGQPEIVASTREALALFEGFKRFRDVGGYPPHGILFEGPPGTGKTLLGKAIAGEAGVPFLYASGSSFTNMYMGVGNLRIARLFRKARRLARAYGGAVVFIDELDAVGGSRGVPAGLAARPGLQGAEVVAGPAAAGVAATALPGPAAGALNALNALHVNELLVQMDGITMPGGLRRHLRRWLRLPKRMARPPQHNLMVIGATNQAAALDPALLRPGRFDRRLHVGLPSAAGRADILRYYLDKVPHEDVDVARLARATTRFSPAEIRNLVNEALIFALSDGRERIRFGDLWQAKVAEEIGLKDPAAGSWRDREMTAVHEAGHALAAYVLLTDRQVQMASIARRGGTLGIVHHTPLEERHTELREDLRRLIVVGLAGMAAEECSVGEVSNAHFTDLQRATLRAAEMLGMLGMGESLISYAVLGQELSTSPLGELLRDPDNRRAIGRLLADCKQEATDLLRREEPALHALSARLLEAGEVPGEEIEELLRAGGVTRAAPVLTQRTAR